MRESAEVVGPGVSRAEVASKNKKEKKVTRFKAIILSIFVSIALAIGAQADDGDVELVRHMTAFQYFSHKLALSIDHQNQKLAIFYLHELEEILEAVKKIESYDGHPIGSLAKRILAPAVEDVEKLVKIGDWSVATGKFDRMIAACNTCHTSTGHAYIKIKRSAENPFMQSFAP